MKFCWVWFFGANFSKFIYVLDWERFIVEIIVIGYVCRYRVSFLTLLILHICVPICALLNNRNCSIVVNHFPNGKIMDFDMVNQLAMCHFFAFLWPTTAFLINFVPKLVKEDKSRFTELKLSDFILKIEVLINSNYKVIGKILGNKIQFLFSFVYSPSELLN